MHVNVVSFFTRNLILNLSCFCLFTASYHF